VRCISCDGYGTIGPRTPCPVCEGSGAQTCATCEGSGERVRRF
jgi:hypothetical protein